MPAFRDVSTGSLLLHTEITRDHLLVERMPPPPGVAGLAELGAPWWGAR